MIYLDHLTTTPPLPEVIDAMQPWLRERFGAGGSLHQLGLETRDALDEARARLAKFVNAADPEEIIFTSGGTETVNLAVKGAAFANRRFGKHIVTTPIEHPAVLGSIAWLEKEGFECTHLPIDSQGRVDPEALGQTLRNDTTLVCLHHASHDLGTIQSIAKAAEFTQQKGIPLFVDATLSGGWLPLDVQKLGADFVALAPHRFHGPKGVGILYRHRRTLIESLIHGGMQENELRAGTENIAAIVGAGAAAEQATANLGRRMEKVGELQSKLLKGIRDVIEGIHLNGPEPGEHRIPHHLSLSSEQVEGEGQALAMDLQEVAIHAGAACTTKSMRVPPALDAIGVDPDLARGTTLWGIGAGTSETEITGAIEVFADVTGKLRAITPAKDLLS